MMEPLEMFVKLEQGVWRCTQSGQLTGPSGRIINMLEGSTFRSGHTYMDLDVAKWLENRLAHRQRK